MSDKVIEELRREIGALRARVFELEGARRAEVEPETSVARIEEARVSRRTMLGKTGVAAAAGVAGAVVGGAVRAQPAAAAIGDPISRGIVNEVTAPTTISIRDYENNYAWGVRDVGGPAARPGYIAAYSRLRNSGSNMPAFRGDAEASNAFYGTSRNLPAVFGTSTGSAGVQGNCTGSGPAGVIGASTSSAGVYGVSTSSAGVYGVSTSGTGVSGQSTSSLGVSGTSSGSYGVSGTSSLSYGVKGKSTSAAGVYAESTAGALEGHGGTYGAWLQGGKAAIRLVPQTAAGKPTSGSHLQGELLCDKNGALWVCTVKGTPGTWKQVRLV